MDKDHVFYRVLDNKLTRCHVDEAEYARVPIDDYVSVEAWNNLVQKYRDALEVEPEVPEGQVMISQEEYNGLQNALRIVRERAVQQIDKARADEHGYTLLRADYRVYGRSKDKAWLVTKSTPYSAKIGIREARFMILKDLREYYNFVKGGCEDERGHYREFNASEICKAGMQYNDPGHPYDFLVSNNKAGKALYCMFEEYDGVLGFELSKLSVNYAAGTYEVSYWATDLI